jgi:phosphoribosylglycinamide formyltransferase-1
MSKPKDKRRIAVFASGEGTNLQALIDACKKGDIFGEIVAVVSNKKYAYALTRARTAGIEALCFEPEKFPSRTVWCSKIAKALNERNIDLVCLAGFMVKVEACLIRSFPNRIINIHPALLPSYGGKGMFGRHVHEAVIAAHEKESGASVHLVDEIYDHGAVIAQSKVKIDAGDTAETLAKKIHEVEYPLYVSVVRDICEGKINLDERVKA